MKRRLGILSSSLLSATLLFPQGFAFASTPQTAQSNLQNPLTPNPNSAAAIQYEQQHHASHAAKVRALLQLGLSQADAEFYASVDDKMAQLEAEHKSINLNNVTAMTPQQEAANPNGLRQQVLQLNPAAIKATLESPIYTRGTTDMNKMIAQNPNQNKYVVQYPDGSSITVSVNPGTLVSNQSTGSVSPQGYSEAIVTQQYTNENGTWQNGGYTWQYQDGSSVASLGVFGVQYSVNNDRSSITGFQTGQSAYGIVQISNAAGIINYPSGYSDQTYAQVENQVQFSVSGSIGFTASFWSLSINSGMSWTQYAIFRVWGNGLKQQIAAQYT